MLKIEKFTDVCMTGGVHYTNNNNVLFSSCCCLHWIFFFFFKFQISVVFLVSFCWLLGYELGS